MTGIRKKIIPESFNINLVNVWNTVQDDLPLHKQAIKKLLVNKIHPLPRFVVHILDM